MPELKKILLVEDNYYIRDIYNITLKQAGYVLDIAEDGDQALAKAKSFAPDLIFLDIMIPGKSGLDVLKLLRTDPQYGAQNTKVVLLTNFIQDDTTKEALSNHADGYIIKADIMPGDLINVIKSFENKPQEG